MDLNHKIKQILVDKNLSPSQFADDIGVQRSSISHILAGRNRPSLDIIKKIVSTYADVEIEWLLDIEPHTNANEDSSVTLSHTHTEPIKSAYTTHEIATRDNNHRAVQARATNTYNEPVITPIANREVETFKSSQEDFPTPIKPTPTILPPPNEVPTPEVPLQVERILVFYTNGTFKEYKPS